MRLASRTQFPAPTEREISELRLALAAAAGHVPASAIACVEETLRVFAR